MNIDPEAAAEAYRRAGPRRRCAAGAAEADRATVARAAVRRLHHRDRRLRRVRRAAGRRRPGLRPCRLRHGADRPHAAAPEPAQGVERLPRGQRPRCGLPRAAFGPEDAARQRFKAALAALGDPARDPDRAGRPAPERAALARGGAHGAASCAALGLANQHLVVNGVFRADGPPAMPWPAASRRRARPPWPTCRRRSRRCRATSPAAAVRHGRACRPCARCWPARPQPSRRRRSRARRRTCLRLGALVDELAARRARPDHGHGQGRRRQDDDRRRPRARPGSSAGTRVHLSTTDPAAHLAATLAARCRACGSTGSTPRPRPQRYVEKIMATKGRDLDAAGPRPAARGPALALHRGGRGLPRLLADRRRGARRLRRARHRPDRPHPAAHGRDRRLPPADACATLEPSAPGGSSTPLMRLQDPGLDQDRCWSPWRRRRRSPRRRRCRPTCGGRGSSPSPGSSTSSLAAAGTRRSAARRGGPGRAGADRARAATGSPGGSRSCPGSPRSRWPRPGWEGCCVWWWPEREATARWADRARTRRPGRASHAFHFRVGPYHRKIRS